MSRDPIEGIPIGHLAVRDGVVRSADSSAIDLLGTDPTGASFVDALREADRSVFEECFAAGLRRSIAIDCRPASGVEWVRCWIAPTESGIEVTVIDRTADRRADHLATYDSAMAHDLRNPLNVIEGRLALLDGDGPHHDAIGRATSSVADRIDGLRDLARAGEPLVAPELCSIDAIVESAAGAAATGSASVPTPESGRRVVGDPDRLEAAIRELLENAVVHGDADRIDVSVGDSTLRVTDDGSGPMDPDRVFEAGYTSDPDRLGYGLTRVDWTARAHGWSVDVEDGDRFAVAIAIGDPIVPPEH